MSPTPTDIVVIGEHSLFFIDHTTGELFMQRRLEYKSTAVCAYPAGDNESDNLLVASNTGHVMVYDNLKLIWASNVPRNTTGTVVHVQVAEFFGQRGLISLADDEGQVAVVCLGTRPTPAQLRDDEKPLDYDRMDEEHRKLLATIRQTQNSEGGLFCCFVVTLYKLVRPEVFAFLLLCFPTLNHLISCLFADDGGAVDGSSKGTLVLRAQCPNHLEEEDVRLYSVGL